MELPLAVLSRSGSCENIAGSTNSGGEPPKNINITSIIAFYFSTCIVKVMKGKGVKLILTGVKGGWGDLE